MITSLTKLLQATVKKAPKFNRNTYGGGKQGLEWLRNFKTKYNTSSLFY
jgi:hypothetical protein